MIRRYDPAFIKTLKKLNVKIRKSYKERIRIFAKNSYDSVLNNHILKGEYEGYRSIDITANYRAIYKEKCEGEEIVAYFVLIGTHKELYIKSRKKTN